VVYADGLSGGCGAGGEPDFRAGPVANFDIMCPGSFDL
jgi:hypothetical protein